MKWLIIGAVLIIVLALAVLLPRKSVHAELVIQAEPAEVWAAVTDTASYGEWNPIFRSVTGSFAPGAVMEVSMQTSDGSFVAVEAVVEEMVPNRLLHQRAGMTGVLTADHQWLLEEDPAGTRVIQHEEYRGIGVPFYDPSYVEVLYAEGLAALKARLEGDAP